MLTPIVIDDVHPRTPPGFPAKAVGGEHVPVVRGAGGRRPRSSSAPGSRWRRVGDDELGHRAADGEGSDRWTGLDLAVGRRRPRAGDRRVDRPLRHLAPRDRGEGRGRPGRGARAGGGRALLLEDLADEAARRRRRRAPAGGRRRRPPHQLLARGAPGRRLRRRGRRARRPACPTPGSRRRRRHPLWVDRPHAGHGRLVRAVPAVVRRVQGRGRAPGLRGRPRLRRRVPAADPPDRHHATARVATTRSTPAPDDPGSPWAIGSADGGHDAVDPDLGTIDDFDAFVARAAELGLEVALDYALQCSPDHPWVRDHPEWFQQRPDGSIRYAENPPKKYQDIHPIEFWPARGGRPRGAVGGVPGRPRALDRARHPHVPRRQPAHEAAGVLGVGDRRRPRADHPEVLFLAEAFTTPAMMAKLAEVGFSQSYTYFTWRHDGVGAARLRHRAHPGPARRLHAAVVLAQHAGHPRRHRPAQRAAGRVRDALRAGGHARAALRHLLRLRAVRERAGQRHQHRVPPLREVRAEGTRLRRPGVARPADPHGERDPPPPPAGVVAARHPLPPQPTTTASSCTAAATSTPSCCCASCTSIRARPTTRRCGSTSAPSACRRIGRTSCHDELSGDTYVWGGEAAYVRLDPTAGQVAHLLHVTC